MFCDKRSQITAMEHLQGVFGHPVPRFIQVSPDEEPGAVNFNILHSLLHVIIQQSHLQETEVEFHGDDANRVQVIVDSVPPFPTLKLSEYTVFGEAGQGPAPSQRPPTNKTRDERTRRPDDDRRPKSGPTDEKAGAVQEGADKLKVRVAQGLKEVQVAPPKSGPVAAPGKPGQRPPGAAEPQGQADPKQARREGDKEDKRPRDREEKPRDDRPRDKEEKPRDDRPRDKDGKPQGREEKPREERRGDEARAAQRGDDDKSKMKPKPSADAHKVSRKRTTVVVVEPYDMATGHDTPHVPAATVDTRKSGAGLKKSMSTSVANTKSYQQLLKTVAELQEEMAILTHYQMPTNEELLEGVRSKAGLAPVGEMWEFLKLVKRVDGAEEGIEKLTSMIEDLAGESPLNRETASSVTKLTKDGDVRSERIHSLEKRIWEIENRLGAAETRTSMDKGSKQAVHKKPAAKTDASAEKIEAAPSKSATASIKSTAPDPAPETPAVSRRSRESVAKVAPREPIVLDGLDTQQMIDALKDELNTLRKDVDHTAKNVKALKKDKESSPTAAAASAAPKTEPDDLRQIVAEILGIDQTKLGQFGDLEQRLNSSKEHVETIDEHTTSQLDELQRQIMELEKELGAIQERLNAGSPTTAADDNQDLTGLGELYNKITSLQADMDSVTGTTTRLADEREERKVHMDALVEQIELLKTIKADKEDLEDALADKADQNTINRKVSHDQFDAACDDLSRGLEEALAKLGQQEAIWQQALDDIQREMDNKLDKVEISPLKDFVNSKLKLLQERLKALAALRKETEAAGTKHKLLRNVNCISCDKEAVMKMEDKEHVVSEPLPPNRSMRAYLTYELDAIRKQQRRLPGSRNLNQFESAVQDQQKRDRSKDRKRHEETVSADHLCNRYCGGSHTITTPQQRVTRMGHFLAQWGPEAIPLRKAQRPRALSIADKMMMMKGLVPPKTAPGDGDKPGTPQTSPRSSQRPASAASIEVIKPAKLTSTTKRASQTSKPESPPRSSQSLPKAGSRGGTPPKEGTPPKAGTPTEGEEVPPPAEGEAPPGEEGAAPADVGAEAEEGAAPEATGEGDAAPPAAEEAEAAPPEAEASEAAPPEAEASEAAPPEAAEAAPEEADAAPPPEPEAEAAPAEEAPAGEEPAAEPE